MEQEEIKKGLTTMSKKFSDLIVIDNESMKIANDYAIFLKNLRKKWVDYWSVLKKESSDHHKNICKKEKDGLEPIDLKIYENDYKIKRYLLEQEKIRQAEQRRLDDERREREEEERKKLEQAAKRADKKGNEEKADELRTQAEDVYIPPVIVQPQEKTNVSDIGKTTGIKDIKITVVDPMQILKNIIDGKLPLSCIKIEEGRLKSFCKSMKIEKMTGLVIEDDVHLRRIAK